MDRRYIHFPEGAIIGKKLPGHAPLFFTSEAAGSRYSAGDRLRKAILKTSIVRSAQPSRLDHSELELNSAGLLA
jgi:hypothetical protein